MTAADVQATTNIYSEVFSHEYISFGELAAGLALSPKTISKDAIDKFQKSLVERMEDQKVDFLVATCENSIVGFALASFHTTSAGHIECWLDDLGVSQNYRHQGIGKKLVAKIIDWGTQKGAKYFLLESGIKNKAAHNFFQIEDIGFQPIATVFWKEARRE